MSELQTVDALEEKIRAFFRGDSMKNWKARLAYLEDNNEFTPNKDDIFYGCIMGLVERGWFVNTCPVLFEKEIRPCLQDPSYEFWVLMVSKIHIEEVYEC